LVAEARQMAAAIKPLLELGDFVSACDALDMARQISQNSALPQVACVVTIADHLREHAEQLEAAARDAIADAAAFKAMDQVTARAVSCLQVSFWICLVPARLGVPGHKSPCYPQVACLLPGCRCWRKARGASSASTLHVREKGADLFQRGVGMRYSVR
jgi:hypothetical protein